MFIYLSGNANGDLKMFVIYDDRGSHSTVQYKQKSHSLMCRMAWRDQELKLSHFNNFTFLNNHLRFTKMAGCIY